VFAVLAFTLTATVPAYAQKKEKPKKEKKEKKPFSWPEVRPKALSEVEEIDTYILTCDTLWERITTYRDSITFFKLDTTLVYDEELSQPYQVIKIVDDEGNPKNFSGTLMQTLEMTSTGISILADVTIVTLEATTAGLGLASNPMLLLSGGYGKAVKSAPQFIKMAYAEVKEIVDLKKEQSSQIKSMKKSQLEKSTDQAIVLPYEGEEIDFDSLPKLSEIDLGSNEGAVSDDVLNELEGLIGDVPAEPK